MPEKILDLHTHMFNARYLPLEGILGDLAGTKASNVLVAGVAQLLYCLTGSSYHAEVHSRLVRRMAHVGMTEISAEPYIEAIWALTYKELLAASQSQVVMAAGRSAPALLSAQGAAIGNLVSSELFAVIHGLDDSPGGSRVSRSDLATLGGKPLLAWAGKTVRRALRRLATMFDPMAWGRPTNYLEFIFTLLASEETIFQRLRKAYGSRWPLVRAVHYMMDMQYAFPGKVPPYYAVERDQMGRMQQLQRDQRGKLMGFWAFDPRRRGWETLACTAISKGFLGFKFYPGMGYRPMDDPVWGERIEAFFAFCLEWDKPVFAHCTPEGFQTRAKQGYFADPVGWAKVLQRHPQLRLCLGHAGGGRAGSPEHHSDGWEGDASQWREGNYAWQVVQLCTTYPNVYCEVGHLTALLSGQGRQAFLDNLQRARETSGQYPFMDKLMYGTDWHMPAMLDVVGTYLDTFLALFDMPDLKPFAEGFFWRNGYRFLKLPDQS